MNLEFDLWVTVVLTKENEPFSVVHTALDALTDYVSKNLAGTGSRRTVLDVIQSNPNMSNMPWINKDGNLCYTSAKRAKLALTGRA